MYDKDGKKIEDEDDICEKCKGELVFHGYQPKKKDRICQKCKGDK